jgi:hypothetical protein
MNLGFSINSQAIATRLRNWQTILLLLFFMLAPAIAPVIGVVKPLNVVGLTLMFLLFAGSVLLVPATELPAFYRFSLWVFFFGFLLNVWYELLHSVFGMVHFARELGLHFLHLDKLDWLGSHAGAE